MGTKHTLAGAAALAALAGAALGVNAGGNGTTAEVSTGDCAATFALTGVEPRERGGWAVYDESVTRVLRSGTFDLDRGEVVTLTMDLPAGRFVFIWESDIPVNPVTSSESIEFRVSCSHGGTPVPSPEPLPEPSVEPEPLPEITLPPTDTE